MERDGARQRGRGWFLVLLVYVLVTAAMSTWPSGWMMAGATLWWHVGSVALGALWLVAVRFGPERLVPRRLEPWLAALAWLLALAMVGLVWREPWELVAQSQWLGPSEHVWALRSDVFWLGKGCVLLWAWLVVRGFPRWRSARAWLYLGPAIIAVAVLAAAARLSPPQYMG
jgi:hypothetical protein